MPKDYLALDTNFPSFTGTESTDQKVDQLYNYTFMLLENLRYVLRNLDGSNFNEAGLKEITDPIYAEIKDAEGNIAQLQITAEGLAIKISDAEGNISSLQQTAEALETQISDAEGNISSLQQTAETLETQISDAKGNISSLEQKVDSFKLTVSNGGTSSEIKLSAGEAEISSAEIVFNGLVKFTDLNGSAGTIIDGGAINTTNLIVRNLYGEIINLKNNIGDIYGIISITGAVSSIAAIDFTSFGALRMTATNGDCFIQGANVTLSPTAGFVSAQGTVIPSSDGIFPLGTSAFRWSTVYLASDPVVTSDREEKNNIDYDLERYRGFFRKLRPCSFRYNSQEPERTQLGFVVQDVEEDLTENQLGYNDFAGIVIDHQGEKEYRGLRANHITALNTWMIQDLLRRVEALEGEEKI